MVRFSGTLWVAAAGGCKKRYSSAWLLAKNASELESMIELWISHLEAHGLHIPAEEISYCTTLLDTCACSVSFRGKALARRERNLGHKVLGTQRSLDGRQATELDIRINKAENILWAFFLVNKLGCFPSKLRLLQQILRSVGLWGAGAWHLTSSQLSKLRGFQQKPFRKMIRASDASGMQHEIMIRLSRKVKYWRGIAKWEDLDVLQKRMVHEWAGHVARMGKYRPDSLPLLTLQWRRRQWLDNQMAAFGHQRHFFLFLAQLVQTETPRQT